MQDVLRFIDTGLGATLQDSGRPGWRQFGIPRGGPMDDHAASWANRLLDNPPGAAVIELLLQGARLELLRDAWIAVTGANSGCNLPSWRAIHAATGKRIEFPRNQSGVWIYVAVAGGFAENATLGSVSANVRARLGKIFAAGDAARRQDGPAFSLPKAVSSRIVHWTELRNYNAPPPFNVWPGPQWESFTPAARARFFNQEWTITQQSDRTGYRLEGPPLNPSGSELISEPVLEGSVQIPPAGLPIVTMRDGPTVGGYPKIALVDPPEVSWLAQCRPGTRVRFQLHPES